VVAVGVGVAVLAGVGVAVFVGVGVAVFVRAGVAIFVGVEVGGAGVLVGEGCELCGRRQSRLLG